MKLQDVLKYKKEHLCVFYYHVQLRRCFNKILRVTMKNVKKINEQQKIIQESRQENFSKTLIQIVVLLNVVMGLTITVSSIFFISLF